MDQITPLGLCTLPKEPQLYDWSHIGQNTLSSIIGGDPWGYPNWEYPDRKRGKRIVRDMRYPRASGSGSLIRVRGYSGLGREWLQAWSHKLEDVLALVECLRLSWPRARSRGWSGHTKIVQIQNKEEWKPCSFQT